MSNYEKLNFTSGQVLKAEHLNHMEEGIANAGGNEIFIAEYGVSTFKEVDDAYKAGYTIIVHDTKSNANLNVYSLAVRNSNTYIFTSPIANGVRSITLSSIVGWIAMVNTGHEQLENKISTIADTDKTSETKYPNAKALTSYAVPIPSSISVGQTVKVSAVDESGKPTAWEAMDIPANVSAFQNDVGYITEEQVNALIDQKLAELINAEEVSY